MNNRPFCIDMLLLLHPEYWVNIWRRNNICKASSSRVKIISKFCMSRIIDIFISGLFVYIVIFTRTMEFSHWNSDYLFWLNWQLVNYNLGWGSCPPPQKKDKINCNLRDLNFFLQSKLQASSIILIWMFFASRNFYFLCTFFLWCMKFQWISRKWC